MSSGGPFLKVFGEGLPGGGLVSTYEVQHENLVAGSYSIPLREAAIEYGGSDHAQLVIKHEKLVLYAKASEIEPLLRSVRLANVDRQLKGARSEKERIRRKTWAWTIAFLAACVLGVWGLSLCADWLVGRAVAATPAEWERQLGKAVAAALATAPVTNPAVVGPVEKTLERVCGPNHPYHLTVNNSTTSNAFAAPGGEIVVFTGLLKELESPEELAGVLAHEVQHVVGRHSLHSLYHSLKWSIAMSLLFGDERSTRAALMNNAASFAQLSFSRDQEREADRLGLQRLLEARIDPSGMQRFFEREAATEGATWFSTHPASSERAEYLKRMIPSKPDFEPLDVGWKEMKEQL